MEHSVQGLVLVNGEWVSRPADIYQIMAGAQRQQDVQMSEPEEKPRSSIPQLGILSRTVISSPFIKFILPANIRPIVTNDVVFVGETSVHLKEVGAYGHLRHVLSKTDFNGTILAARVYGGPRKAPVKIETETYPIRPDIDPRAMAPRWDRPSELYTLGSRECLVLTLSIGLLVFLWVEQRHGSEGLEFRQKRLRLPAGTSIHDRVGQHLAVDPLCRAIAVAASEGQFVMYKSETMEKWEADRRVGLQTTPIEDERVFPIQGRVMHMEFLSPNPGDDRSHVVLLLILAHKGKTKITCYDWDARYGLKTASVRAERVSADVEDHNPSLAIPLSRSSDFLLVCDRHISTYRNILSGTPQRYKTPIDKLALPSLHPGNGKRAPRWVQWERVARHDGFSKEAFYIAREDGMVIYAELGDANNVDTSDAGTWPHPIDKAFASVDPDAPGVNLRNPDVLVAAGTVSDGSLCRIGAWVEQYQHHLSFPDNNTFRFIEPIPNWSPIADLEITRLPGIQSPSRRERDCIFIANGKAPHGTLSELRRGLNAMINISSEGMHGCTGIWIIDHGFVTSTVDEKAGSRHYAVLLITIPPETIVIRISRIEGNEWHMEQVPGENEVVDDGILRDETMSASLLSPVSVVQITRKEAQILSRPELASIASISFPDSLIAAATSSRVDCIAVTYRDNSQPILRVLKTSDRGFDSEIRLNLKCDPTCLQILEFRGDSLVFVGTVDSFIRIYRIGEAELQLVCKSELGITDSSTGTPMVCESAVFLNDGQAGLLACGTRDGHLVTFDISVSYHLYPSRRYKMGQTSVRITGNATDPCAAFLACGPDFCRISYLQRKDSMVKLDSIWFTDQDHAAYQQSPITALDQHIPATTLEGSTQGLGSFLFAVSGDKLLLARLDCDVVSAYSPRIDRHQSESLPLKIMTHMTPTKLMYLEKLRKVVVACIEAQEERAPPFGYRSVRSCVQLMKLDDGDGEVKDEQGLEVPRNRFVTAEYPLKNYERVYSIVEWTIVHKGKTHHFIVLGTGVMKAPGKETGRRLFLQAADSHIKLKKETSYDEPVRCMALFNEKQLVTIVGRKLVVEEYELEHAKWQKRGTQHLTSPGIHVSIVRPFIYVSTAEDSHVCYHVFRQLESMPDLTIARAFNDSRERKSAYHLPLTRQAAPADTESSQASTDGVPPPSPYTIVLLTDKTCNVAGILHPSVRSHKTGTHTLFEAQLPRSVTRIKNGQIRPPWRQPCIGAEKAHTWENTGILADDIIGTCTDGTVYAFSILSDPAIKLLKFIQDLIELTQIRDPKNNILIIDEERLPQKGSAYDMIMEGMGEESSSSSENDRAIIKARDVDPNLGRRHPRMRHVDGDVIAHFVSPYQPTDKKLDDLVQGVGVDVHVEKEVAEIFLELSQELFEEDSKGPEGHLFKSRVYKIVGRWLEGVVLDIL